MDGGTKRMRLGLALIVWITLVAAPSMADRKVNLFNPFSLQSKSVVVADTAPSVALEDLVLLGGSATAGMLGDEVPRPTISLRGHEIRIPSRPSLRSSFSRFPAFDVSAW